MIGKLIQLSVWTLLAVAAAGVLGYLPSRRAWGEASLAGMGLGCAVGVATHWVGLAAYGMAGAGAVKQPQTVLMSTAMRFGAVVMLSLAAALSGLAEKGPLLIWVAISYLVGLFVDTLWLVNQKLPSPSEKA